MIRDRPSSSLRALTPSLSAVWRYLAEGRVPGFFDGIFDGIALAKPIKTLRIQKLSYLVDNRVGIASDRQL
jgi:hypothetical protein